MKLMKRDFLLISTVVTGLWSDCSEQRLEYECNPPPTNYIQWCTWTAVRVCFHLWFCKSRSNCCRTMWRQVLFHRSVLHLLLTAVYRFFSLCCVCLYKYGERKKREIYRWQIRKVQIYSYKMERMLSKCLFIFDVIKDETINENKLCQENI